MTATIRHNKGCSAFRNAASMHAQHVVTVHRPVSMFLASPWEFVWPFSGQVRRPEVALTIPAAVPAFFVARMLVWLSAALGPAGHFATMHVPAQYTKDVHLPAHSLVCCLSLAPLASLPCVCMLKNLSTCEQSFRRCIPFALRYAI